MDKAKDKKQEIINDYYCHDSYAESCDFDCGNCKDLIKKDIDELGRLIRADAIDEFSRELKDFIYRASLKGEEPHWTVVIDEVSEQLKEQNND